MEETGDKLGILDRKMEQLSILKSELDSINGELAVELNEKQKENV